MKLFNVFILGMTAGGLLIIILLAYDQPCDECYQQGQTDCINGIIKVKMDSTYHLNQ